jgi:YbbR domain-containing protein
VLNRTYTRTLAIPITFTHYPLNKHINNRLPAFVMADVKASGAKLVMLLLKKSLNEITVDVSDVVQLKNRQDKASVSTLTAIGNLSKLLNTDVELIKVKPDSIHFIFGKTFTKKVFVKPRVQISYDKQEGIYKKIKTSPQFLIVSSDSVTLSKIDTLYTEKIVLNDLNKNIEQQANIELPEELDDLVVLSQNKVQLKINLDEFVQKKIQIPVVVLNSPAGASVKTFPAFVEVTVSAPYKLYDSLGVSMFKAKVDFNSPEKAGGKLKVKVTPNHTEVKVTSCTPEKVEYILRKK